MSNSILTNTSAMAALATLRSINSQLDTTQNRISSGLKVATASDNAAYWSIATTMKSDNGALSSVSDALGLGASTVDVAYTGMNKVIDNLNTIKNDLVTAQQPGVDKSKIQADIASKIATIQSIASSANFAGSNWLSIDSSGGNTLQSVVASLTRDSHGQISLGTISIDTTKTALFDSADGGAGLLQKAAGNTSAGNLAQTGTSGVATVLGADKAATFDTGNVTLGTTAAGDEISFDLTVGGATQKISVTLGASETTATVATKINSAIAQTDLAGKVLVSDNGANNGFDFTATSTTDSISLANYADTTASWSGTVTSKSASPTATGGTSASAAMNGTFPAGGLKLDGDDTITFTLNLDGTDHAITIDQQTALTGDTTLTKAADGTVTIGDLASFQKVVTKALTNANLTVDADLSDNGGAVDTGNDIGVDTVSGKLEFLSAKTGTASTVQINNLQASSGSAAFNLVDLDVTNATSDQLSAYMNGVDQMISAVTNAASDIGAKKTQISDQSDFLSSLMDSITTGVGRLVDADMNAESTRLKALQTQQQLGIQALSIANSNSQSILQLFR